MIEIVAGLQIKTGHIDVTVLKVEGNKLTFKFDRIDWPQFAKHIFVGDEVVFNRHGNDNMWSVPQFSKSDRHQRGGAQILFVNESRPMFDLDS